MEVGRERIDPDSFQWEHAGVGRVEFAAALRFANADPIGGLVTGAGKTLLLDEGLQQHGAVAIAVLPIKREQACSHAQQLRGEVLGRDPGEDEEAGVVHDQVQPTLPLGAVPADERVARCGLPCGCAETEQGEDAAISAGEVAQLGAG